VNNAYRYALLLYREDETPLGQAALEPDWDPAVEWTWFEGLRRGRLGAGEPAPEPAVRPLWLDGTGEPYLRGFRVELDGNGAGRSVCDFSTAYFQAHAESASSRLVEEGRLDAGDRYRYLAAAFPRTAAQGAGADAAFNVRAVPPELAIEEASLADALAGAGLVGVETNGDMPVVLPPAVLAEAAQLARQAEGVETGGILIGHLHRDPAVPEIFARVTAQIPARETEADSVSLTFTAETWTDVRAALDLRHSGELMLGWWHSHPVREWCKDCSEEKQRQCPLAAGFLSAQDRALHRAVFPRAYSLALLANDVAFDEPTFTLFGWRQGRIERRGFHLLGSGAEGPLEPGPEPDGGQPAGEICGRALAGDRGDDR